MTEPDSSHIEDQEKEIPEVPTESPVLEITPLSLEPVQLQEDAYRLLMDAFRFHRAHSWIIVSLLDKDKVEVDNIYY